MAKKGNIDKSILEISVADAANLIGALPNDLSVMLWGAPGIGKTFSIRNQFEPKGIEVIPVLAGCSEPTDFTGIPFDHEGRYAKYLIPEWAYRCSTDAAEEDLGPKVLFLDDIVTAHEQTQAACFKMVHERMLGSVQFRDNVRIIAAGNRIDDKSAATEMPMALGNRFLHFHIKCDTDVWLDWARKNSIHPSIVAYIRTQPHRITTFEDALNSTSEAAKAFATPRSWEMLSMALTSLESAGLKDKFLAKISMGTVGSVGSEFAVFCRQTEKLIPPDVIVKDPKKAPVPKDEDIDILYATVSSLEHFVKKKENNKYWQPALAYALRILPELGLILAKQVTDIIMEDLPEEEKVKAATSKEFKKMFQEWGDHLAPEAA